MNLTRGISYRHGLVWHEENVKNIKGLLKDFKTKDVRIIIGSFNQTIARHMFCHVKAPCLFSFPSHPRSLLGSTRTDLWLTLSMDCSWLRISRRLVGRRNRLFQAATRPSDQWNAADTCFTSLAKLFVIHHWLRATCLSVRDALLRCVCIRYDLESGAFLRVATANQWNESQTTCRSNWFSWCYGKQRFSWRFTFYFFDRVESDFFMANGWVKSSSNSMWVSESERDRNIGVIFWS